MTRVLKTDEAEVTVVGKFGPLYKASLTEKSK